VRFRALRAAIVRIVQSQTSSKQKSARFCYLREKKVWKALRAFWDGISGE